MAEDAPVPARVMRITRETVWTPAGAIRLKFRTFHPQGMVRIGDTFFISSVEVRTPPSRLTPARGGHDRDAGAGVGHLFRVGADGALLGDLVLGEGSIYHPGGLDFDGRFLWVPVAEYRPDSRALLYRIDPATMRARQVLRVADHIGALAFDRRSRTLHGVSWGSRRFYSWRVEGDVLRPRGGPTLNPEHYIDYQDCHGVGAGRMLCGGLAGYRTSPEAPAFQLGGLDLVDLASGRPVWQAPVQLWSPSGRPMTQNAVFVEARGRSLRAYFLPDDDESTLFIYDAAPR